MRICFLSWRDGLHPEAGGAEVFLEEISRALVQRGHDVTIVTSAPSIPGEPPVDGITRLRRGGRLTVFARGWWYVLTHRRRHDVVVEVLNGVSFCSRLARPRRGLVVFHHSHQRQWTMLYPGWRGHLGRLVESAVVTVVNRRSRWVTVSDSSRRDLESWRVRPDRITVIANAATHVPGIHGDKVPGRLVCTARLVPHKQVEHAIDVVAALRERRPDVRLEVIGEGYWCDELRDYAAALGVSDRVRFHGHLPAAERDAIVATAQLNLLPSAREGWGLVISESARSGVPSIAYRGAGGVSDAIVDGTTGRLVETPQEFVAAVEAALADPLTTSAWGEAARQAASARTWADAASEFEQVLQLLEP